MLCKCRSAERQGKAPSAQRHGVAPLRTASPMQSLEAFGRRTDESTAAWIAHARPEGGSKAALHVIANASVLEVRTSHSRSHAPMQTYEHTLTGARGSVHVTTMQSQEVHTAATTA